MDMKIDSYLSEVISIMFSFLLWRNDELINYDGSVLSPSFVARANRGRFFAARCSV